MRASSHIPQLVLNYDNTSPEAATLEKVSRLHLTGYAGGLTHRGATRVHRLAWTVADLRRADRPGVEELDVALRLRTGEPLLLTTLTSTSRGFRAGEQTSRRVVDAAAAPGRGSPARTARSSRSLRISSAT